MAAVTDHGLLPAMLAVQAAAPALTRDKSATVTTQKGSYSYRYSSLDTVMDAVGPLLTEHKLVWSTQPSHDGPLPTLRYELMHAETGEVKAGEMLLLLAKDDPQGQGSAITYARRYALVAVLNLVADDDDDGQASMPARSTAANTHSGTANTIDLRSEAKGLTDKGIKVALTAAGVAPDEKPWGQLGRIPIAKATAVREALEQAQMAETSPA